MPLAEHDFPEASRRHSLIYVSIHVPLAEHDAGAHTHAITIGVSIHVPLAEHDCPPLALVVAVNVSIHVPLAEHDGNQLEERARACRFNSRASRGARLKFLWRIRFCIFVSIHVPLAEHDRVPACHHRVDARFNSRAPRGARQACGAC